MSLLDKASIISIPLGYDEGTYNNVKPMQVLGPANEVTNGTFDFDLDWTLGTKWSISGGKLNSVGTASTDTASQVTSITLGKTYKVQYTVSEYALGGVRIKLGTATGATRTADGIYTEYITAAGSTTIYFEGTSVSNTMAIDNVSVLEATATDFVFERTSVGTRINEAGLIEELAEDLPRINYDDGVGYLMLEPQSTNLCTESNNTDNWTNFTNVTVTKDYDYSPSGDLDANRLVFTGAGYCYKNDAQVSATEYTLSVWAKRNDSGTQSVGFFKDGSFVVDSEFTLTNQWQRFTYTYTSANTSFAGIAGTSKADISFYGFQREALGYATSLINTSGTAVTRVAESCADAGNTFTIDSEQGCLYAEIKALNDDGTYRYITLSDGTSANAINLLFTATSNEVGAWVRKAGVLQAQLSYVVPDMLNDVKIALSYDNNEFLLYVNGEKRAFDYSGDTFAAGTLTGLHFDDGSGLNKFIGKAKSVIVFPEVLSDLELQTLTGGNLSPEDAVDAFETRVAADDGIMEGVICLELAVEAFPDADGGRQLFDVYNERCGDLSGSTEARTCTIDELNALL